MGGNLSKKNYQAWQLAVSDSPLRGTMGDLLRFLVSFAVLAPSSHNLQQWRFRVHDNTIFLKSDLRRALPYGDIRNRQMFLSIGCALENILVAADYFGLLASVRYLPCGDNGKVTCEISFIRQEVDEKQNSDHLIHSILTRRTNRFPYKEDLPNNDFVQWLQSLNDNHFAVSYVTDEIRRSKIADLVISSMIEAMDDDNFRRELAKHVKNNFTSSPTGLVGFSLGMPGPVSVLAPLLMRKVNMAAKRQKIDHALLAKQTPAMVVISSRGDTPVDWLRVGKLYEQIALRADQQGLTSSIWGSIIEIGNAYRGLAKIIDTPFRPQLFFRLGYPTIASPTSPRFRVTDVLEIEKDITEHII